MTLPRIQFLTHDLPGRSHAELAESACRGGVRWIQYRAKGRRAADWIAEGREVLTICRNFGALLIVNDSVEVAFEIGADGVHLGKDDVSPTEARRMLGRRAIIGGTANTPLDVRRLVSAGVDYLGVGPLRFTETKERARLGPLLGIDGVAEAARAAALSPRRVPVFAVGGVNAGDLPALFAARIYGAAISGAIAAARDPEKAAREIIERAERLGFTGSIEAYETAGNL